MVEGCALPRDSRLLREQGFHLSQDPRRVGGGILLPEHPGSTGGHSEDCGDEEKEGDRAAAAADATAEPQGPKTWWAWEPID